jgi:hypothetical protein
LAAGTLADEKPLPKLACAAIARGLAPHSIPNACM